MHELIFMKSHAFLDVSGCHDVLEWKAPAEARHPLFIPASISWATPPLVSVHVKNSTVLCTRCMTHLSLHRGQARNENLRGGIFYEKAVLWICSASGRGERRGMRDFVRIFPCKSCLGFPPCPAGERAYTMPASCGTSCTSARCIPAMSVVLRRTRSRLSCGVQLAGTQNNPQKPSQLGLFSGGKHSSSRECYGKLLGDFRHKRSVENGEMPNLLT